MDNFKETLIHRFKILPKAILICFVVIFVLFIVASSCDAIKYDQQFDSVSPSGTKTVTVKTDYVSRPDVYYNDECIFEYPKSGFNETVLWQVEWISEDEIRLYLNSYDDEDYVIAVQ